MREELGTRGVRSLRGIGSVFKNFDSIDGNRKLDKEEFYLGLKEYGVNITKREAEALLEYLDLDQDGQVNFDEFLLGLRGKPNAVRQAIIDKVFAKFDKEGNGYVTSVDLKLVYDTSRHPKVISGDMCEDEVYV